MFLNRKKDLFFAHKIIGYLLIYLFLLDEGKPYVHLFSKILRMDTPQ
jgi:hypothetical protein